MKKKNEVIDGFFRDFQSECDGFFHAHIDGIWTNGYCHGRSDLRLKLLKNIADNQLITEGSERDFWEKAWKYVEEITR